MKIGLFSAHSFSKPGGVQNHVLALYREFKRHGIEAKIIAPGHAKPLSIAPDDFLPIGVTARIPANQSTAEFSLSVRRRFRKRIHDEKFDVLHFHNLTWGPLSYQIVRSANSLNILTVHSSADASTIAKMPIVKELVRKIYEPKFQGVIAVSPVALETIKLFGGFKNGSIKIIPNGIDLTRFTPYVGCRTPHIKTLLFVGRLEKRKGLLYLLRAFQHLRLCGVSDTPQRMKLLIVGEGEQRKDAEQFIAQNKLEPYVHFAGAVPDSILPQFYQSANIFCAPAVAGESFGMTLLEAMACGIPVVGFANPGYQYVMQGHEREIGATLLAQPKDYKGLAQKIEMLLNNDALFEKARAWGLTRVKDFAWPKIADQILNFYEEAAEWQNEKKAIHTARM